MSIGIKIIIPNQTLTMCHEYQGSEVKIQSSAKSSEKMHNTAITRTLVYYGLTDVFSSHIHNGLTTMT